MNKKLYAMAISAVAMTTVANGQTNYPQPPVDNSVTDNYFGTTVADRFRPLENDTAAATTKWVEAENALTRNYLDKIPFRSAIRERLTQLNNFKRTGLPYRDNDGKYYFYENDGLQNHLF